MAYANDNHEPISGKAAAAWPAMTRAKREGEQEFAALLRRFARLYEVAHTDPDAIASPAGRYKEDGELALGDSVDEVAPNEDGSPADSGYQMDFTVEYGPTPEKLAETTHAGAYSMITRNIATAGVRNDYFRIMHAFLNGKAAKDPARVLSHSWAEYRGKDGKWYRVEETLDRPRGPRRDDSDELLKWCHTIHPSGNTGATHTDCAAEERLDARQQLDRLRHKIGNDAYGVLRMIAVDRSTAQAVGEARGQIHKRASALGATLIWEALQAANDNWAAALTPEKAA
jgi:hypothetical protein